MEEAVILENVSKKIKNKTILNNISLELRKGRIYGIKGRNGSGKTMLLRVICGLLRPDSGKVIIQGEDITEGSTLPEDTGVIIETPGFIDHYSGFRNLKILAAIRNVISDEQIIETMKLLELDPYNNQKVKTYSLGMRQRLGIVQAIMENPELIILDEPTNALDDNCVKIVHETIKSLKEKGKTIIIASHNAEDINILCDEVFEMDNGNIKKIDSF